MKVVSYLLNPGHPFGVSKAKFFAALGFVEERWDELAAALKDVVLRNDVTSTRETGFGPRFEVDGILRTPRGVSVYIRTVWQIDHGTEIPRLITAFPLEEP